MIMTAETYKKKGIEQYRSRQYEDAISSFDQAITLGDRSVFIYDMKITSMSKVDMKLLTPGDKEYQARALHAVEAIIKKFEKNQDVWKLHYRKADILYRRADLTFSLVALKTALETVEKLPTRARLQAREVILTLRNQVSETMSQNRTQASKNRKEAAEAEAARRSREARLAERRRTNWYATAFPPEILVMICKFGMTSDCALNRRMAGVCRAWEGVILGEKMLWQTLVLGGKYPVKKAILWAKYCQGSLREVVIGPSISDDRAETVAVILDPFLESIQRLEIEAPVLGLIARWKHRLSSLVDLKFFGRVTMTSLDLELCKPGATTLRSVHLKHGHYRLPHGPARPESHHASESGRNETSTEGQVPITPISEVRSLRIEDSRTVLNDDRRTDRDGLLSFMPNIEVCELKDVLLANIGAFPGFLDPKDEGLILPRLRCYRETNVYCESNTTMFGQRLDAPELRELAVSDGGLTRRLDQLLQPGFHPDVLVSLDVSKIILLESAAVDFFRNTPALRFLNVSACALGDEFLQALEHQDGLDEQLLPALEALSMCSSEISGGAVRDFVNSRLPFEDRMPSLLARHYNKPKPRSAFRPTSSSSQPQAEPLIALARPPSPPPALIDETVFSTQPGVRSTRPRIKWLCLDDCTNIDPVYITLLKKYVKYVSWWLGTPNFERQKGMGRWDWDGEIEACVDSPDGRCYMRQVAVGSWAVVHNCQKLVLEEAEDEKKEKGWSRTPSAGLGGGNRKATHDTTMMTCS